MSRSPLSTPVTLGALSLPNRVVMAPMTRNRATGDGVPTPIMATYYAQRASAGLIVAEMAPVAATGVAYPMTPGIYTDAQTDGWRHVTDAVHAAGGRILLQIAHGGRISHPALQPNGETPVAPSAIRPDGSVFTPQGPQPFVTPRALEVREIAAIVAEFADGARRARDAGFDGIELHAANGYLIDQFLRDGANDRTDAYGGSAERRARMLVEIVEAVSAAWSADRVGVRVSPFNAFNSMSDSDPVATFTTVASLLDGRGLAYLHVVEPVAADGTARLTPELRRHFSGPVLVNGGYDATTADAAIARGEGDAVSFGVPFIGNPDLAHRLALAAPLRPADPSTFYAGGERGYTDYAALAAA